MLPLTANDRPRTLGARVRRLLPSPVHRAATRFAAEHRASSVRRELAGLVAHERPILVGPWLGEVGFELLYWIPFLRWFAEHYEVPRERLIAVSRGGGGAAWYTSLAARSHDALSFIPPDDFRRRNLDRSGSLGEQKQVASQSLDDEIVAVVREAEGREVSVLHPSLMYRLYSPYWWGHRPVEWLRQYARFSRIQPPALPVALPAQYTAVKFYFNDCFEDTAGNRAFVQRLVKRLADEGPVISLSTGVIVDDHSPCEPDVASMHGIQHLLTPESNLIVQSAIVGRARRFVGTYGGFAYLAPLGGVPALSYYSRPGSFSVRHLELVRDVLRTDGEPGLLDVVEVGTGDR